MNTKILNTILLTLLCLFMCLSCASTPEEDTGAPLTQSDLIGTWEIEKPFTYKDEGIDYGKATDTLIFSKGSSEEILFLEVAVVITEATSNAPEGFEVGSTHTLFLNETSATILENNIMLDANSPYLNPSTFNFTFEDGDKSQFVWDGITYTKK